MKHTDWASQKVSFNGLSYTVVIAPTCSCGNFNCRGQDLRSNGQGVGLKAV